jgi:hypothetical protein
MDSGARLESSWGKLSSPKAPAVVTQLDLTSQTTRKQGYGARNQDRSFVSDSGDSRRRRCTAQDAGRRFGQRRRDFNKRVSFLHGYLRHAPPIKGPERECSFSHRSSASSPPPAHEFLSGSPIAATNKGIICHSGITRPIFRDIGPSPPSAWTYWVKVHSIPSPNWALRVTIVAMSS